MPYSWEQSNEADQPQNQQPNQSFLGKVGNFVGSTIKSTVQPFVSGIGSGVRSIEATPKLASAIGDKLIGNEQNYASNLSQAQDIMARPIFGDQTLQGMNTKEALGTAAKTASFLAPELHTGVVGTGAIGGGLFGAGEAAQNNQSTGKIVASGAVGALGGAAVGKILDHVFNGSAAGREFISAQGARQGAADEGVQSMDSIINQVRDYKSRLGQEFAQGAAELEQKAPDLRLNLSNEQMDALNSLKESKVFSLPDYLQKSNTEISIGGKPVDLGRMNPNLAAQLKGEITKAGGETSISLTPTQAQDLITQLDKSTFRPMADGSLQIDQQRVGLTNEIKAAANQAFGKDWQEIYANYAKGRGAIDSISDFVKIGKNLTASDKNKALNQVLRLSQTPEGQKMLQNSIDAFKNTSGIDLNDPVSSIQKILSSDETLKAAEEKATKPGALRQVFNPTYLGRYAVRYALGYLVLRELLKSINGQ